MRLRQRQKNKVALAASTQMSPSVLFQESQHFGAPNNQNSVYTYSNFNFNN